MEGAQVRRAGGGEAARNLLCTVDCVAWYDIYDRR